MHMHCNTFSSTQGEKLSSAALTIIDDRFHVFFIPRFSHRLSNSSSLGFAFFQAIPFHSFRSFLVLIKYGMENFDIQHLDHESYYKTKPLR